MERNRTKKSYQDIETPDARVKCHDCVLQDLPCAVKSQGLVSHRLTPILLDPELLMNKC